MSRETVLPGLGVVLFVTLLQAALAPVHAQSKGSSPTDTVRWFSSSERS